MASFPRIQSNVFICTSSKRTCTYPILYLREHIAQTMSTVEIIAPHNPHLVTEQVLMVCRCCNYMTSSKIALVAQILSALRSDIYLGVITLVAPQCPC